jgi:hypothetical protein
VASLALAPPPRVRTSAQGEASQPGLCFSVVFSRTMCLEWCMCCAPCSHFLFLTCLVNSPRLPVLQPGARCSTQPPPPSSRFPLRPGPGPGPGPGPAPGTVSEYASLTVGGHISGSESHCSVVLIVVDGLPANTSDISNATCKFLPLGAVQQLEQVSLQVGAQDARSALPLYANLSLIDRSGIAFGTGYWPGLVQRSTPFASILQLGAPNKQSRGR